jgi:hypothetical protein
MSKTSGLPEFAVALYIRKVSVDRALRGLLFLMIGMLATAVPIIQPVGSLIALTGVIWYVLGRDPFGEKQSNYTILAAALFLIGLAFILVGSMGILLFILSLNNTTLPLWGWWWGNDALAWALVPSLTVILEFETIGAFASGLAYVLFTYLLQRPVGRALLLLALVINVAINILVFSVLSSNVPSNSSRYFLSFDSGAGHDFANQVLAVGMLNLIPAIIYAGAYYDLHSRIREGLLPPPI